MLSQDTACLALANTAILMRLIEELKAARSPTRTAYFEMQWVIWKTVPNAAHAWKTLFGSLQKN
jgi:hypothetical protein